MKLAARSSLDSQLDDCLDEDAAAVPTLAALWETCQKPTKKKRHFWSQSCCLVTCVSVLVPSLYGVLHMYVLFSLSLSLHVLPLLLSVLDDKVAPAAPEDDGKLSVGVVLVHPLAVCFCVCLLVACGCSRERGLAPPPPPTFRPPSAPCRRSAWTCMRIFESLFCAGFFHLHPGEAAPAAGTRGVARTSSSRRRAGPSGELT